MMSDDSSIQARLQRIEALLTQLITKQPLRDYYTTGEVAKMLGRADWTVREWCRLGRIWAEKRAAGRGASKEWMISRQEVERIQNEGLLPL